MPALGRKQISGGEHSWLKFVLLYELFLLAGAVKELQSEGNFLEKVELCKVRDTSESMTAGHSASFPHRSITLPQIFHLVAEYESKKIVVFTSSTWACGKLLATMSVGTN